MTTTGAPASPLRDQRPPHANASPFVGAVVLNWHGRAETLQCLRALAALRYPNLSLVLIDNDGREFTPEEVARLVTRSRYVPTDVNLGFAAGSNLGMRQALQDGADYVWFLNNDAQPEPDALAELVEIARGDAAVVGAKILQARDARRLDSIALDINLRSGRIYLTGHDEIDRGQYDSLRDTLAVTGCAMLVSRTACEQLGGFDECFCAYLEDADLCLRARAAGLRVVAAPRARVLHRRAPATCGRQSAASLYYTTRNHLMLMDRHGIGPAWSRRPRVAWVIALNMAYALRAGGGFPRQRLVAVWRGVRDYQRGVVGATWETRHPRPAASPGPKAPEAP